MITSIARYVTDFLLRENVISTEYMDLYIYGFEVIQAGTINVMIVLFMGLLFDQLINGLLFYSAFCMLRKFCGGYHADTYLKCNLLLALNVGMVMTILTWGYSISTLLNCIVCVLCLMVIWRYAPIQNKNKELSENQMKRYKRTSVIMGILLFCSSLGPSLIMGNGKYMFSTDINLALMSVAIAMMVEICMGRRRAKGEKNIEK